MGFAGASKSAEEGQPHVAYADNRGTLLKRGRAGFDWSMAAPRIRSILDLGLGHLAWAGTRGGGNSPASSMRYAVPQAGHVTS